MSRAKKKYHYLYKTINLINNKYYYGMHSTSNLNDGYLGSGKRLRYSINKYGKENFKLEIIKFCKDKEELAEAEKTLITEELLKDLQCMNLKPGGYGGSGSGILNGFYGKVRSTEHKEKMLDGHKLKFSDEQWKEIFKKDLSDKMIMHYKNGGIHAWIDRKHTEETKNKMSNTAKLRIGDKCSSYGTYWITKDGVNKKIKREELETYLAQNWIKGRKVLKDKFGNFI